MKKSSKKKVKKVIKGLKFMNFMVMCPSGLSSKGNTLKTIFMVMTPETHSLKQ